VPGMIRVKGLGCRGFEVRQSWLHARDELVLEGFGDFRVLKPTLD
jgi:hypothetical protein